jgi:alpha-methylacyl-CoA racemase
MKAQMVEVFATRTRDDWCATFGSSDACFAPVLSIDEALADPHNVARATFVEVDGVPQPAPAPRFSRTPGEIQFGARRDGADSIAVLGDWGIDPVRAEAFRASGIVA